MIISIIMILIYS